MARNREVTMALRALRGSTSTAALFWYWRSFPPEDLAWGWMVLCFPAQAVYLRLLRSAELQHSTHYDMTVYGAFDQFSFTLLATSPSLNRLRTLCQLRGYTPMLVQ